MKDYVLFMHSDAERKETTEEWDSYFTRLRASGQFQGGSAIGSGECFRKSGPPGSLHSALTGYIRIQASSLDEAKTFVEGILRSMLEAQWKCVSFHGAKTQGKSPVTTNPRM